MPVGPVWRKGAEFKEKGITHCGNCENKALLYALVELAACAES
jgi:hypothetical protein